MKLPSLLKSFTKFEIGLYVTSVIVITISFILSQSQNYLSLAASLIGATALIFVSKGSAIGQFLTVVFSVLYGIISLSFRYYGEMITYLGMTAPIAVLSIVTWLRNPHNGNKKEVKVNRIKGKEYYLLCFLSLTVTTAFYFILRAFNTQNLILSTVSVTTSFFASYLTMRRSEYYAIAYAANDAVLIALWVLAAIGDLGYLSMVICFIVFFVNDVYGFFNWSKMKKRQNTPPQGVTKRDLET